MTDLKLQVPATEEVEVDAETLAAIDRGLADAQAGRLVSAEEVRKRVAEWNIKYSTPTQR